MSTFVPDIIAKTGPGVIIFAKSYCPYCHKAIKALHSEQIVPVVVQLDERKDGAEIQADLLKRTGQRTVPSVWLAGKHIGGASDTLEGIKNGLFSKVPKTDSIKHAENAGITKCKAADGIPCLCY